MDKVIQYIGVVNRNSGFGGVSLTWGLLLHVLFKGALKGRWEFIGCHAGC